MEGNDLYSAQIDAAYRKVEAAQGLMDQYLLRECLLFPPQLQRHLEAADRVLSDVPADAVPSDLEERLQRAWERFERI